MARSRRTSTSDEQLIVDARAGDNEAFAELWHRHSEAARRAAWHFRGVADPDDLVSEAYARILSAVRNGKGPGGAFRPYLFVTIRNLVNRMSHAPVDGYVDDFDQIPSDPTHADPAIVALDRTLTARAFRSLPVRWQTVLWYTEVEGLNPSDVGPLLGLSANSTAALAYRARDGLRIAWLQAHVNDETASEECRWMLSRMGAHVAGSLSARDQGRARAHLADCARCGIVSEEIDDIGSKLALVMLPLLLGGAAGTAYLAERGSPASPATAQTGAPPTPGVMTASGGSIATVAIPAAVVVLAVSAVVAIAAIGALDHRPSNPVAAPPAPSAPQHPVDTTQPPLPEEPEIPAEIVPPAAPPAVRHPTPGTLPPAPAPEPEPEEPDIPSPEPEGPDILAPAVTTILRDDQAERPSLAGTAGPLSWIEVTDQHGNVVGTATTDMMGNWSTGQLSVTTATTGLSVVQTGPSGAVSPATVLGPLAFHPAIGSPTVGLACRPGEPVDIELTGWAGEPVLYDYTGDGVPSVGALAGHFDMTGTLAFQLSCDGSGPFLATLSFYYANSPTAPPRVEVAVQILP